MVCMFKLLWYVHTACAVYSLQQPRIRSRDTNDKVAKSALAASSLLSLVPAKEVHLDNLWDGSPWLNSLLSTHWLIKHLSIFKNKHLTVRSITMLHLQLGHNTAVLERQQQKQVRGKKRMRLQKQQTTLFKVMKEMHHHATSILSIKFITFLLMDDQ